MNTIVKCAGILSFCTSLAVSFGEIVGDRIKRNHEKNRDTDFFNYPR
jgi:hypothetical protein